MQLFRRLKGSFNCLPLSFLCVTKGKITRCSVEECHRLREEAAWWSGGVAWSQYLPIKYNSELNEIINDIAVLRHC